MKHLITRVVAASMVIVLCVGGLGGAAEQEAELLRFVANGWQANFERVRTWKGVGKITVLQQDEDGRTVERREAEAHFAYDVEAGARRWRWHYTLLENNKTGVTITNLRDRDFTQTRSGMFKDDAFFRYYKWQKPSEPGNNTVAIRHASDPTVSVSEYGEDFDPLFLFGHNGRTAGEELSLAIEGWEAGSWKGETVERHEDIVTRTYRSDDYLRTYEYDLSKGFNLVKVTTLAIAEEGQRKRTHLYEWQETDGVYFPKSYSFSESDTTRGRPTHVKRKVLFDSVEVNKPLGPEEFDLASLGVEPRDDVSDRRTGSSYIYGLQQRDATTISGEELVDLTQDILEPGAVDEAPAGVEEPVAQPVAEPGPQPETVSRTDSPARSRRRVSRGIIVSVAAVTLVALAVAVWASRKKKATR